MTKEHEYASAEKERRTPSPEEEKLVEEKISPEEVAESSPEGAPARGAVTEEPPGEKASAEAPPKEASSGVAASPAKPKAASPSTAQPKILVVDDTSISRVILRNILTRMGAKILEASNGQEALWEMEKTNPDLVITDLSMPVMDGFTMMDKAKNVKGENIPVIVVSVYADKERLVRAVRLGAVDYIVKPFEQETVVKKVQNALKNLRENKTGILPQ
jgi:CheY-like chemotaxis protein